MDEEPGIVVAVKITFAAVSMVGIFLLVFDHGRLGIKVPITILVCTFDLHFERRRLGPGRLRLLCDC
jgi:hypothetical protein